jgi:hypothetical protein
MQLHHRNSPRRRWAIAAALAASAGGACAEGPQDKYWAELEYFFPTITSEARLDFPGTHLPGTQIRLEDDLGLSDRKGTPYLLLGARFAENWRVEFEYYTLKRSATHTIARDIHWGDAVFPASATLNSLFDSDITRLTVGWSFLRTQQYEAGAALGLHITNFKVGLSGQGNGPAGLSFQSEQRDQTVPLPTLGLYGNYMLTPEWILRARVDWLSIHYQNYDGSLVNWLASGEWRFAKNWGAGLGYRYVNYKVDTTKENFYGEVKYNFKGPTLYVTAAF